MPEKIYVSLPVLKRILAQLGEHIKEARLRRGFSAEITAQRAGMSRVTLGKIEKGNPSVTMGSYLNVLHVLGLHQDLLKVAEDDELGRKIQDAQLPLRKRVKKSTKKKVDDANKNK